MDTYYISAIYRSRPSSMLDLRFGQWFCNAHKLTNPELFYEPNVEKCKLILIENWYDTWDLTPLKEYNSQGKKE